MEKKNKGGTPAFNGYKILSIVLAAIIAVATLAELILWRLDYIVFQNPNAQEQTENLDDDMVMTPQSSALMSITAERVAASGETYETVTLTATVLPEEAVNKEVDWSVAWVNSSEPWAKGKTVTDYVTVTPESDGAAKAAVKCSHEFGAQIQITATSRDNAKAKGVCLVDFRQKVIRTDTLVSFNSPTNYGHSSFDTGAEETSGTVCESKSGTSDNTNTTYNAKDSVNYKIVLSDTYTLPVSESEVSFKYYVKLNPEFAAALKAKNSASFKDSNMAVDWTLMDETTGSVSVAAGEDGLDSAKVMSVLDYYYTLCNGLRLAVGPNVYYFNEALYDFREAGIPYMDTYHFQIKIVATIGGAEYETIRGIRFGGLDTKAESVDLSQDHIEY